MIDRSESVVAQAVELSQKGSSARGYVVELSDEKALRGWLQATLARLGVIDIVVNNAGIHPKKLGGKYLIEEIDIVQWRLVLDINLTAPFLICGALLPGMKKQGWGRVVNIGSAGARNRPLAPSSHYVASKAAIAGLTRCIAEEGAKYGITANCLSPGPIKTGLTAAHRQRPSRH
jgi:3-oxoacyl-[acyl-carrier protein] reductase